MKDRFNHLNLDKRLDAIGQHLCDIVEESNSIDSDIKSLLIMDIESVLCSYTVPDECLDAMKTLCLTSGIDIEEIRIALTQKDG